MPGHYLVLGVRLRYLRQCQELDSVQKLLTTPPPVHNRLRHNPASLPPDALPWSGDLWRHRQFSPGSRPRQPVVFSADQLFLGALGSLEGHDCDLNGLNRPLLRWLDLLRCLHLREAQQE